MSSSSPWIEPADHTDRGDDGPAFPLLRRAGDAAGAPEAPEAIAEGDDGHSRRPEVGTVEVLVRLTDGDVVLVGRFGDPEEAKEHAQALVESLSEGTARWPFVSGRFLRPEAIVSIDVNEHGPKWTGSADRAASWKHRGGAS